MLSICPNLLPGRGEVSGLTETGTDTRSALLRPYFLPAVWEVYRMKLSSPLGCDEAYVGRLMNFW